jgi:chromosome segregation ATPase
MALKNLEDRYNNISTEPLYKKMVQYIQSTYPNAPDFLAKLNTMHSQLTKLQTEFDTLTANLPEERKLVNESLRQGYNALASDIGRVRVTADRNSHNMEDLQAKVEALGTKVGESAAQVTRHSDLIDNCYKRLDTDKTLNDERLRPLEEMGRNIPSLKEDLARYIKLVPKLVSQMEGLREELKKFIMETVRMGSIQDQNKARPR